MTLFRGWARNLRARLASRSSNCGEVGHRLDDRAAGGEEASHGTSWASSGAGSLALSKKGIRPPQGTHLLYTDPGWEWAEHTDEWVSDYATALADGLAAIAPDAAAVVSLRRAADVDIDAAAWYTAGTDLFDIGLGEWATAPMSRALELRPDEPNYAEVLAVALDWNNSPEEAARMLRAHPQALARSVCARLLLAEYSARTRDLPTVRAMLADTGDPGAHTAMFERAIARIGRADVLATVGPQAPADLRWWEAVVNGTLLLHSAPADYETGRGLHYGWSEKPAGTAAIVDLLGATLAHVGFEPVQVVTADDRDSQILGEIIAARLRLPSPTRDAASAARRDGTVLAVCFDWFRAGDGLVARYAHEDNVVLFAYHLHWEMPYVVAPDIVGLVAQSVIPAWGDQTLQGVAADNDTPGKTVGAAADMRPAESVAAGYIDVEPDLDRPWHDDSAVPLSSFVDAMNSEERTQLWGLFGGRRHAYQVGPLAAYGYNDQPGT